MAISSDYRHTRLHIPRPSNAVVILISINVMISILLWLADAFDSRPLSAGEQIFDLLTLPPTFEMLARQPWRIVTYMFTQFSPRHILFNMAWLYFFGIYIKERFSNFTTFALYLTGGIGGGLLFIVANQHSALFTPPLAGASASVIAIIAAMAIMMNNFRVRLIFFGKVRLLWIALVALILSMAEGNGTENPAFTAHLGGLITGMIWGTIAVVSSYSTLIKESIRHTRHRLRLLFYTRQRRDIFIGNPTDRSINASKGRAENRERLDFLLDKIRLSGYNSLSAEEKDELIILSRNL